ncbi:23S rRNA (pseudouridine(1915)-N(3))-methyltransferase RlmH [Mycoplasmopsis synoviae]|uniref:23S rRNA (pseudouridine(1915)-N(3))-methyltransferase RlmH n=1 Tax=Mycoplasmopsis synoviae TaxID=2109 RepID=UPI00174B78AC|nr:23S rRNA (pseudouridine(1915)-N(3))-methyltransferase RlmH [Mycoplasmopsis synoviae]MBD5788866.1 ribosomal RNA large subunit methyltransferase H [Mycoplasmopsis synoviae GX11-T]UBX97470.1 23S rRNA (pseudouridine(1915)-N(3))-methyltransferase RlmH [Mycoplasmopsis synoviae]UBX98154.1 23S rRNA (pseudouridine(1915)-N(3))-methyltransferase RlmH [Mycoplasmopsis synoviae]UBX98509.1 23S rRNA (pseudouridine(1915)-N(3))-methyltransferase RlmH [Mycoplasmopsis synoviae]UBX99148.1 23S rRNA (pseudouridin
MTINLIAVGKLEKDFQKLFDEYAKRIFAFSKFNLIEIKENTLKNLEVKKEKETLEILSKIPKNSTVFLLSIKGKNYSSEEFSKLITNDANITFVIGGSNGVIESYFENKISFSKLTFPHQLFRVILIEQIYRAFTIKNNLKYHK